MSWSEYIEKLRKEYIGRKVRYQGRIHTIVDVDYNGILHIDLPTEHNETSAVFDSYDVKEALI